MHLGSFSKAAYSGNIGGNGIVLLGSASLVWNYYRDMHSRRTARASGTDPPVFQQTPTQTARRCSFSNHQLSSKRPAKPSGQMNAKLLREASAPSRALQLRDYAYTDLRGLIVISNGSYTNRRTDVTGVA